MARIGVGGGAKVYNRSEAAEVVRSAAPPGDPVQYVTAKNPPMRSRRPATLFLVRWPHPPCNGGPQLKPSATLTTNTEIRVMPDHVKARLGCAMLTALGWFVEWCC